MVEREELKNDLQTWNLSEWDLGQCSQKRKEGFQRRNRLRRKLHSGHYKLEVASGYPSGDVSRKLKMEL